MGRTKNMIKTLIAASIIGAGLLSGCAANSGPSSQPQSPITASCMMGYVNIPAGSGLSADQKTFQANAPSSAQMSKSIWDGGGGGDTNLADYEAMQVIVSASQDTMFSDAVVVWYDTSGKEISSATIYVSQLITAGQSLSFTYDESAGSSPNPPQRAATCNITSYNNN